MTERASQLSGLAPRDRVEANQGRKRGGRRGRGLRTLERQIDGKARDRQAAWAEGERANETERLSHELKLAFEELRAANPDSGDPYAGRTTAPFAQPPKVAPPSTPGHWPTRRPDLYTTLADDDYRALWATAFYGGLRRGELRALRWGDIDLAAKVIHVRRGWDDVEGEQDVKSDAGERDVPILDPLRPELAAHKLRTASRPNGLVFGLTSERPFPASTVRRRTVAAWKAAALEPIGLHEARHTCASVLIAAGCNAKVIQKVMGHATITMTFDQYGHLMPGGLEEAAAAANAFLARALA